MIVTGDQVSCWVATELGIAVDLRLTVGVGYAEGAKIIQGAAFYNFTPYNIYVHVALASGHGINPTFIAAMLDYPFNQAKVRRLTGLIPLKNHVARKFAEHLGGKVEGVHEKEYEFLLLAPLGLTGLGVGLSH